MILPYRAHLSWWWQEYWIFQEASPPAWRVRVSESLTIVQTCLLPRPVHFACSVAWKPRSRSAESHCLQGLSEDLAKAEGCGWSKTNLIPRAELWHQSPSWECYNNFRSSVWPAQTFLLWWKSRLLGDKTFSWAWRIVPRTLRCLVFSWCPAGPLWCSCLYTIPIWQWAVGSTRLSAPCTYSNSRSKSVRSFFGGG